MSAVLKRCPASTEPKDNISQSVILSRLVLPLIGKPSSTRFTRSRGAGWSWRPRGASRPLRSCGTSPGLPLPLLLLHPLPLVIPSGPQVLWYLADPESLALPQSQPLQPVQSLLLVQSVLEDPQAQLDPQVRLQRSSSTRLLVQQGVR